MRRTNTAQWMEKYNRWQIKVQKDGVRKTFYSSKPGRTGQREANAKAQTAKAEGGYTVTGEGDPAIDALVMQRYEAKKSKNFAEADRIRDELKAQGIEIVDTKDGASWKRV